jgi:hypothetical protein
MKIRHFQAFLFVIGMGKFAPPNCMSFKLTYPKARASASPQSVWTVNDGSLTDKSLAIDAVFQNARTEITL